MAIQKAPPSTAELASHWALRSSCAMARGSGCARVTAPIKRCCWLLRGFARLSPESRHRRFLGATPKMSGETVRLRRVLHQGQEHLLPHPPCARGRTDRSRRGPGGRGRAQVGLLHDGAHSGPRRLAGRRRRTRRISPRTLGPSRAAVSLRAFLRVVCVPNGDRYGRATRRPGSIGECGRAPGATSATVGLG